MIPEMGELTEVGVGVLQDTNYNKYRHALLEQSRKNSVLVWWPERGCKVLCHGFFLLL